MSEVGHQESISWRYLTATIYPQEHTFVSSTDTNRLILGVPTAPCPTGACQRL